MQVMAKQHFGRYPQNLGICFKKGNPVFKNGNPAFKKGILFSKRGILFSRGGILFLRRTSCFQKGKPCFLKGESCFQEGKSCFREGKSYSRFQDSRIPKSKIPGFQASWCTRLAMWRSGRKMLFFYCKNQYKAARPPVSPARDERDIDFDCIYTVFESGGVPSTGCHTINSPTLNPTPLEPLSASTVWGIARRSG